MPEVAPSHDTSAQPFSRREEITAFVVLAVLIWPLAAIALVGGYGFLVWMYQVIFGPPGPPH